jgi:hypothetical protein
MTIKVLKKALEKIAYVTAMDYEYQRWAREALAITELESQEQNFCSRCGKRTADLTTIHTCTPPQRTWVGLTESDRKEIERQSVYVDGAIRMTEAKLKEKNT